MIKKSVSLKGHRTSVSLEPEFWAALEQFAQDDEIRLPQLITRIDRARIRDMERGFDAPSLASALRVYVVRRLHDATERQT